MKTLFRERLRRGERLIGTIVSLDSTEVVEILAAAGFDWLFLDGEHAPFTPLALQKLLQAAGDVPCVVRVADDGETSIKKALDIGAAGVVVPQVNSAAQAQAVVRRAKYAPAGSRGVGISRANLYGMKFAEYLASANDTTAVIIQAEHIDAVRDIDAIAAVPGVDAVFVGPYDLSASMGRPGALDAPEVRAAIERVAGACRQAGVPAGIFAAKPEAIRAHAERGFSLLLCGVDTLMLGETARALSATVRGFAERT